MLIPPPDRWDESSLYLLPAFAAELHEKTALLTDGPSDDVPLHDASSRIVWLTAAVAKLRRIERSRNERLAMLALTATILAATQRSAPPALALCRDDEL